MKREDFCILAVLALVIAAICGGVWLCGASNPHTPAGYVGYVTRGSVFGKTTYLGTQPGPTSYGRAWLADCVNVSITPYTYEEPFDDSSAVLSKDSVKIRFAVHLVWKVKADEQSVRDFVEHYTTMTAGQNSDQIVATAYANFLKQPLRTFARNELQKFDAIEVKDNIIAIGKTVDQEVRSLCNGTPFDIIQVVVGNIQYPDSVANAVSMKMSATQDLERVQIEAEKRVAEAEGISKAMQIVQQKLTPLYLQHEAIEAQKAMVNSPNHTTIYIPVGPMGVPYITPPIAEKE